MVFFQKKNASTQGRKNERKSSRAGGQGLARGEGCYVEYIIDKVQAPQAYKLTFRATSGRLDPAQCPNSRRFRLDTPPSSPASRQSPHRCELRRRAADDEIGAPPSREPFFFYTPSTKQKPSSESPTLKMAHSKLMGQNQVHIRAQKAQSIKSPLKSRESSFYPAKRFFHNVPSGIPFNHCPDTAHESCQRNVFCRTIRRAHLHRVP